MLGQREEIKGVDIIYFKNVMLKFLEANSAGRTDQVPCLHFHFLFLRVALPRLQSWTFVYLCVCILSWILGNSCLHRSKGAEVRIV